MEVFLFLLLCVANAQAQITAVISPSQDYNAALDPNSNIQFNCTGNSDTISWTLDGVSASNPNVTSRGVTTTSEMFIGGGMFLSTLSVPASEQNNNTAIQCTVVDLDSIPIASVMSKLIFFKIQGLLGPPPNITLSEADEQLTRLLTWDAPETLDITTVNPDIEFYRVCYNLSAKLTCTNVSSVEEREFKLANVRVPLLFTVAAFNVVGEGSESSIVHQAINCDSVGVPSIISDIQSYVSLAQSVPKIVLLFNQSRKNPVMCFCVYEVQTVLAIAGNTTEHGLQIPVVENYSSSSVQLSLTIDSDLVDNELYSAKITITNSDGIEYPIGSVYFSTYDVQSVNGSALPGGLELSCTFLSGSLAQGCQLTVCRVENDNIVEGSCMNITINRTSDSSTSTKQVTNLPLGMYTIRQVADVERDDVVNIVRGVGVVKVNITELPSTPTTLLSSSAPEYSTSEGVSNDAGAIAGGIDGGSKEGMVRCTGCIGTIALLLILTAVFVTVVVVAYKCHIINKQRTQVVYDEPSSVSRTVPQAHQLEMEQCPAYGVFNKK